MKYFKNTSWLLIEKILRLTVGLFVSVWVARYLGPEKFGVFSYAQSFVGLFVVFSTLGLDGIVVRELVEDKYSKDCLLGTTFTLKLLGAIFVLLLLAVSMSFQTIAHETTVIIFVVAFSMVFQSFNVIDLFFQSHVLSKYVVYTNLLGLFLSSLIKIMLIINQAPLVAFAYVVLFDSLVLAAGYVFFYYQNNQSIFKWFFSYSVAKKLLVNSWPLILSGMAISIYMKIDQIMIESMLGNAAVGQYAAAARISEAWYFIPVVICSSLFPALLEAKKGSEHLYYSRLGKLYQLMFFIAFIIALLVTFFSEAIMFILYGAEFKDSASILVIHVWAAIFVFLGVASGRWFLSENLQFYSLITTVMGAVSNVALNYLLIPIFGVKGAAWATLASYFIAAYLSLFLFKKTRENGVHITKSLFFIGK